MLRNIIKLLILISAAIGLPVSGIALAGMPVAKYLEFPPVAQYIQHAPFSWIWFGSLSLVFLVILASAIVVSAQYLRQRTFRRDPSSLRRLPLWGYAGLVFMIIFWIIAWTRFDFLAGFLNLTFFYLWLSLVVFINSLKFRRTGTSMLTHQPLKLILLFPLSTAFWWYFEYINGFMHNWYYVGETHDAFTTFLLASLAFSTVLPAVMSMYEYLMSFDIISKGFNKPGLLRITVNRIMAIIALIISCAGFSLIGVFPGYFFFMTWVSPLLLIISLRVFFNEKHILSGLKTGDWSVVVSASAAALICGIFWEMWNYYSFPKWEYSVPFVNRFRVFEMPVLGFLGYIPFGLFCAGFVDFITDMFKKR